MGASLATKPSSFRELHADAGQNAMASFEFDIGVFAVNEATRIAGCLLAIDNASRGRRTRVAVLLNGTTDQSVDIARRLQLRNTKLSIYFSPVADKANAINSFLYDLRVAATTYVCVDGYAWIDPHALGVMESSLQGAPQALIAAGVPANGRSATAARATILRGGAVGGQFFAMKPRFVDRFVADGLRLPAYLYRGDGLLGSIAAHEFDPIGKKWDSSRIIGVAGAAFAIPPLSITKCRDIKRQYVREVRQARGRLENEAIKSIVYSHGYRALPADADEMIKGWLASHRPPCKSLRERYFMRLALRELGRGRASGAALKPRLVFEDV